MRFRRRLAIAAVLLASSAATWVVACSTRDYALCIEHPDEDPVRCAATKDAASFDGAGDGGPPADAGPCPPDMVFVAVGKGFCIDRKEATVAEYQAYLDAGPKVTNTTLCGWKAKAIDFYPLSRWDKSGPDDAGVPGQLAAGREGFPVIDVDWCMAYEYCAAKGKRLCGSIAGGPAPTDDDGGAWGAACNHGDDGFFEFPWGNDAAAKASCNGSAHAKALDASPALAAAGATPTCEGPYPGLFDMLGNAAEWIDLCDLDDASPRRGDLCVQRGGTFEDDQYLQCTAPSAYGARDGVGNSVREVGIRCCK